jgi:uncharacterized protein
VKNSNAKYVYYIYTIFLIPALVIIPAHADILSSKPSGPVNDFAKIVSPQTWRSLDNVCKNVLKKTGVALVLATYASLEGEEIDEVTNTLYEKWGIGQKGKDEGVLVLLAVKERKIRIETGYGVEGYITDLVASRIRQEATAKYLSRSRWDKGITLIFHSLTQLVATEKGVAIEELITEGEVMEVTDSSQQGSSSNPLRFLFILIAAVFLLGTRSGRSMLTWLLLFSMGGRKSHYGGGGFGGGFGGSGGFGGFGGGMSGGGGSSGSF